MKIRWTFLLPGAMAAAALSGLTGCAAFQARVREVDVEEKRHLSARYDYTDMRALARDIVNDLLRSRFLEERAEPPVMMIVGIQNRTSQHVDTRNLTDRIRTLIFESERVRFVNEARREELMREQGYSALHVTPETQVAIGRQLGARYMISGSLTEMRADSPRQVRLSRTHVIYYKLTFEVTDLESNEIRWITEKEFAREARQPLVGW